MRLHMDTTLSSQRRQLPVLLAWCLLLMLAWGLWLWQLDASDLTFDESATYFVAHRPPLEILRYLRGAVREHPPIYYLLINTWMALAGTSEFSLRFFSVGAGLVALALTGWLARLIRLETDRPTCAAGLLPAILLAVVPGMAYQARNARMYSLGIVWTLLSTGLFLRDWLSTKEWPRRTAIISLATVHFLALFTHYYLLLAIVVQPLALLITRRWRPFLTWCGVHSLPAIAGLIWLRLSPGLQMTTSNLWARLAVSLPAPFQLLRLAGKILFSPVLQIRFSLLYWILALTGGGVLYTLWRRRTIGIWLALALPVPLMLAYALPQPPVARYLVFLIPFAALATGLLCTIPQQFAKRRWLALSLTAVLTLIMAGMLVAGGLRRAITFDRSHYSQTLETVQAHARPGDGVIFYGPWQITPFRYYAPGGLPPIVAIPEHAPPHLEPAEAEPVLEELLATYDRLWVIPAAVDDVDPSHFVKGWLRTHAHLVWDAEDFSLYLPPLPRDAPSQATQTVFGGAVLLESLSWEPLPVQAGEPLRLTLHWSPLHRLENDVQLTLELTDSSGRIWNRAETVPLAAAHPPSQWEPEESIADYEGLMVPWGTPPGAYTVRLKVTDKKSGAPLAPGEETEADVLAVDVSEPTRPPVCDDLPHPGAATFSSPDGVHQLDLAGHEPGGVHFQQGHPVPLTLHWLSPQQLLPELRVRLQVVPKSWLPLPGLRQDSVLTRTRPLVPGYPASQWTPGRLVTLHTALTLPPDAPAGPARVTLQVLGPDDVPWSTAGGDTVFPLFDVIIEGRPVLRRLPAQMTPLQADFGDQVGLRGYRIEGNPRPDSQLRLNYTWYARTRPTAIYAVFNHLIAADGTMAAQVDGWPQEGRLLSTQWQEGEYVEDSYTLEIPSDAPPGPYTLYVGLYDAATTVRQPAFRDGQPLPDDRMPIPLPTE
jgi:mannosyltransferase